MLVLLVFGVGPENIASTMTLLDSLLCPYPPLNIRLLFGQVAVWTSCPNGEIVFVEFRRTTWCSRTPGGQLAPLIQSLLLGR